MSVSEALRSDPFHCPPDVAYKQSKLSPTGISSRHTQAERAINTGRVNHQPWAERAIKHGEGEPSSATIEAERADMHGRGKPSRTGMEA
jgi:hypothetical protein